MKGSPIGGIYIDILGMTVDDFIDAVTIDITSNINEMISKCPSDETDPAFEFCEDIVITGTPNDMVFEGKEDETQ